MEEIIIKVTYRRDDAGKAATKCEINGAGNIIDIFRAYVTLGTFIHKLSNKAIYGNEAEEKETIARLLHDIE